MDLNMKVLVVDDFATMRRIIKNALKQIGFVHILEAEDGVTALAVLKDNTVDLIISDWNMPNMISSKRFAEIRTRKEFLLLWLQRKPKKRMYCKRFRRV